MQAIQTNCPWLLRYLVTAIILTKVMYTPFRSAAIIPSSREGAYGSNIPLCVSI